MGLNYDTGQTSRLSKGLFVDDIIETVASGDSNVDWE